MVVSMSHFLSTDRFQSSWWSRFEFGTCFNFILTDSVVFHIFRADLPIGISLSLLFQFFSTGDDVNLLWKSEKHETFLEQAITVELDSSDWAK